jgi:hypothetical protein
MDGFTGFKTATAEELPDATAVMDPFHVVRLAGDALDRCRRRVQLAIHGHRGMKNDPLYSARRTLHTGAGLLTDKQASRLTALFTDDAHVEVEATWGIYQRMIAAYRHEDRRRGRESMVKLIDTISTGVPNALVEVTTLGRTLKKRAVGAGNSGLQIALELSRTREVHLAVGTRQKAIAQRPLGRDLFWWLTKTGLITRPATSPVAAWFRKRGGDLVIGTTWADVEAAGINVHPRLTAANGKTACFDDGSVLGGLDTVVWATGFRTDYSWLDVPDVWDDSQVHHTRGRSRVPGLWFVGLPWQHSRGSALLGFVGDDASWIAGQVIDKTHAEAPPPFVVHATTMSTP